MISIELWRARIGTFVSRFNCKRYSRCSSSLSSSSCNYMYPPPRKRRQNGLACSSSTFSTDLEEHSTTVSSAKPVLPSATLKLLGSITTSSSSFSSSSSSFATTTTTTTSSSSASSSGFAPSSVFSLLRRSVLRDVLIILLIAIISQQLIISGDIETNPGPCLSDRPKFSQLIVLKEALPDGSDLRIVDWLSTFELYECEDFASVLLNDDIAVKTLKSQSQDKNNVFIRAVLHNWLNRDDGKPSDPAVSRTWKALAQCVSDASLDGALAKAIRDACSEKMQISDGGHAVSALRRKRPKLSSHTDSEDGGIPDNSYAKGITLYHGSVQVDVQPDLPDHLLTLMDEYAFLLTVLSCTKLPEDEFLYVKLFLSNFCDEKSIEDCSTLHDVVDILKEKVKIHIFNIATLLACCKHFLTTVKVFVQKYDERLKEFFSNASVLAFKCELQAKVQDLQIHCVELVSLKLKDSRDDVTFWSLKKLAYYCFGNSGKALALCRIVPGCVRVSWLAPISLVPTLRAIAVQHSPEYLASLGVLELVIGLQIFPIKAYYQTNGTMQAMLKTSNPDKDQQISELQDEVQKLSLSLEAIKKREKKLQSHLEKNIKDISEQLISEFEARMEDRLSDAHDHLQRTKDQAIESSENTKIKVLVVDELKEITDWKQFGHNLGLTSQFLKRLDGMNPVNCREAVIHMWRTMYPHDSWADIVVALEKMGEVQLAGNLSEKYLNQENSPNSKGDSQKMSVFQFMEIVAYEIPRMWFMFGAHIPLPVAVLYSIEYQHRFNDLECFAAVFDYWKQMSTPHQPATWASVICILKAMKENELAHFIQETVIDKAPDQSTNSYTPSHSSIAHGDKISVVQCVTLALDASTMWINLGAALGIDSFVLTSIHQRHKGSLFPCFANMFDQWLQLSTPQHPAKWSTLITALQSIELNAVAFEIQEKVSDPNFQMIFTQPPSSSSDSEEVSLLQFMKIVAGNMPHEWYMFGVALGISPSRLNIIEIHRHRDPQMCCRDVYDLWRQLSTPHHPANWATLISALKSRICGQLLLAKKLEEEILTQ